MEINTLFRYRTVLEILLLQITTSSLEITMIDQLVQNLVCLSWHSKSV